MRRSPTVEQPALFFRGDPEDLPDVQIAEVQIDHPLGRVEEGVGHMVEVPQLVLPQGDRPREEPDGLGNAIALVGQVPLGGEGLNVVEEPDHFRLGDGVERSLDPLGQPLACQPDFFRGSKHRRLCPAALTAL